MRITGTKKLLFALMITIAVTALVGALAVLPVFGGGEKPLQEKAGSADFEGGQILVKFKSGTNDKDKEKVHKAKGGKVIGTVGSEIYLVEVEGSKERKSKDDYKKDSKVSFAELNYIAYAFLDPNDPFYPLQWHLDNPVYGGIHTNTAWNVSTGSGVVVAVIDTGVAYEDYSQSKKKDIIRHQI